MNYLFYENQHNSDWSEFVWSFNYNVSHFTCNTLLILSSVFNPLCHRKYSTPAKHMFVGIFWYIIMQDSPGFGCSQGEQFAYYYKKRTIGRPYTTPQHSSVQLKACCSRFSLPVENDKIMDVDMHYNNKFPCVIIYYYYQIFYRVARKLKNVAAPCFNGSWRTLNSACFIFFPTPKIIQGSTCLYFISKNLSWGEKF